MSFNYLSNLGSAINVFRAPLLKSSMAVANPATAMPVRANVSAQICGDSVHITKQSFQTVTDLPNEIFRANSIFEGAKFQKRYFDILSPLFDNLEENYDHLMGAISKDDAKAREKMQKVANIINASYSKINSLETELNDELASIEKKAGTMLESIKQKKVTIERASADSKALLYDEYSSELFGLSSYFGIESLDSASNKNADLLLATNFSKQPLNNNSAQKNTSTKGLTEKADNSETKFYKLYNLEDVQGRAGGIKYMQSFLGSLKEKLEETAQSLVSSTNVSLAKKLVIDVQDEKAGWDRLKSTGWLKRANKDSNLLLVVADSKEGSLKSGEKENELKIDFAKFATDTNVQDGKNKLQKSFILKANDAISRNSLTNIYNSYKDSLLSNAKQNLRDVREEVVGSVQKSSTHVEGAQMQFAQETEKRENVIQNYLYTEFQRLKYMEMIVPQIINSLNKIDEAIYSAFRN